MLGWGKSCHLFLVFENFLRVLYDHFFLSTDDAKIFYNNFYIILGFYIQLTGLLNSVFLLCFLKVILK